jgi:hypothetical protein
MAMIESAVRVRLPEVVESSYRAYVKLPATHPSFKDLATKWVRSHCEEPFQTTLAELIGSEQVRVRAVPRKEVPGQPVDILRAMGMGPEEERRFREATHVVIVDGEYPFRDLPLAVFCALATSNGVAASLRGVVLDPQMPRLLPLQSQQHPLPGEGRVMIATHIVCPMLPGDGGGMRTVGMKRFGLPNFEMHDVPAEVMPIMNAIAQRVLDEALVQAGTAGGSTFSEVTLPAELLVTHRDAIAAFGKGDASAGQTKVRLSYDGKGRGELEPFIAIGPPASFTGPRSSWSSVLMTEFFAV